MIDPRAAVALLLAAGIAWARSASAETSPAGGAGGASSAPRRWRAPRIDLPAQYGRAAVSRLLPRVDAPSTRESFARWGARWMPGVPLAAVVGVSVTSMGPRERVTVRGRVEALGLVNIEPSRARRLGGDDTARADLGRTVDPNDRGAWERDTDGQIYVGLRGYADELASLAAQVRCVEAAPAAWSVWDYACAVVAYSGGPSAAAADLRARDEDLAAIPSGRARWVAWINELTGLDGADLDDSARRVAWALVRVGQRLAASHELARLRPVTDQIPGWGGALAPAGTGVVRLDVLRGWTGEDIPEATWEALRRVADGTRRP